MRPRRKKIKLLTFYFSPWITVSSDPLRCMLHSAKVQMIFKLKRESWIILTFPDSQLTFIEISWEYGHFPWNFIWILNFPDSQLTFFEISWEFQWSLTSISSQTSYHQHQMERRTLVKSIFAKGQKKLWNLNSNRFQ